MPFRYETYRLSPTSCHCRPNIQWCNLSSPGRYWGLQQPVRPIDAGGLLGGEERQALYGARHDTLIAKVQQRVGYKVNASMVHNRLSQVQYRSANEKMLVRKGRDSSIPTIMSLLQVAQCHRVALNSIHSFKLSFLFVDWISDSWFDVQFWFHNLITSQIRTSVNLASS